MPRDNQRAATTSTMECQPDDSMHAPLQETARDASAPPRADSAAIASVPAPRVCFAGASERSSLASVWRNAGAMVAVVDVLAAHDRGLLREAVDRAIERELDARDAPGPGLTAWAGEDGALSDQLFRARRAGCSALAVCLGPLHALVGPTGGLAPEDTATLRFFAAATRERPFHLALDASTRALRGHADPVPLAPLLEPVIAVAREPAIALREPMIGPRREPAVAPREPGIAPLRAVEAKRHATPLADADAATAAQVRVAPWNVAGEGDAWRTWALALTAARGPQPLSAFERLFKESYVPLLHAVARGLDDPRARHAVDDFRRGFSRAYTDAFPTFAVTGKRPKMVLDAPDIAGRLARLHGARAVQLVLVDGMRWDVGAPMQRELAARLGGHGAHAEEMILFSALPTHTPSQLDAIARGEGALRDRADRVWEEEPLRGRTADVLRRTRIGGGRDLYRLDLVETRLRDAGDRALDEVPSMAAAVADVIARHATALATRTLLFVFGDHGFTCDAAGVARHGGASPEEVLVPAHAFVVGDVH